MILWCSHCPPNLAQFLVIEGSAQQAMDKHIAAMHPDTGQWVEGDDWEVLNPDQRGELSQHLANITP